MTPNYIQTVRLLLDIAPAIFTSSVFAMKGGTALNLFVQDMPRLSVDIDVVFLPHALEATRERMLGELPQALRPHHRDFLLSLVRAEPDWSLLPYAHLAQLPALQWKLQNLKGLKRNRAKFDKQHDELAARLKQ